MKRRALIVSGTIAALLIGLVPVSLAYQRPGRTEKIPGGTDGSLATEGVGLSISGDGRFIVFQSTAANLVPGETGGSPDVFVYDRIARTTDRISEASDGTAGDWASDDGRISSNGRYVAFASISSNLVPGDTNRTRDLFVHDRSNGVTERVSIATDGTQANQASFLASISADGRYVAFDSTATNLAPNGRGGVFIRDRQEGTTEQIVACDGGQPSISADGRFVTFVSGMTDLAPSCSLPPLTSIVTPPHLKGGIAVYDRQTRETELLPLGRRGNWGHFFPSISADGRYVVFSSDASDLVPADSNVTTDVFVFDRTTKRVERISVADNGQEGNRDSWSGGRMSSISADGRYVVFASKATNLVPGDTNNNWDAFVHDRIMGATERVSVASDGEQGEPVGFWSAGWAPAISEDGRYVAFGDIVSNLVPADANNGSDVFIRDRGPTVGIGEATASEARDPVSIEGWAAFAGVQSEANDPLDDTPPGIRQAGGELTAASLSYRPEQEDLFARLQLADLPGVRPAAPPQGGGVTGPAPILYGLEFQLRDDSYEVRAFRTGGDGSGPEPYFALFRCDPNCVEVSRLAGGFGTSGDEIAASVPMALLDDPVGSVTHANAYSALGAAESGGEARLDEIALPDATFSPPSVTLRVSRAGAPSDNAVLDVSIPVAGGRFSGSIDPALLPPGDHDVWARACVAQICGADVFVTTLGSTASPTPTASPTSLPTVPPELEETIVKLTGESERTGQYSDATFFEAVLTDGAGDAVAGAGVAFELEGEGSARTFNATTDEDGVASVTPVLEEKPGIYDVIVRFTGDDIHSGSADTITFVVEKEDTDLELTVVGNGNKRAMDARLADRDAPDAGIAGRTVDFYAGRELIGSATTDDNGVATFKPPPRYRGGKHDFEARFEGDDYFVPSTGS